MEADKHVNELTVGMLNSAAALFDDSNDLLATDTTETPSIFCRSGM